MSAIDQLFRDLRARSQKAFIPFVTAGDPHLAFTAAVVRKLAERGCSLCELGIPYSDPIADGPVIQASYTRALQQHVRLAEIFGCTRPLSRELNMPLVSMVSYAVVYRYGLERYVRDALQAGLSGAIIPDLLVEESDAMAAICREHDFSLIQLVTPTTPPDRAVRIAQASSGFLYFVSVTGITGERRELPAQLVDQVRWLRQQTDLPLCIGFGISQPEQVRMLAPVADGVIVGSALVRHLAAFDTETPERILEQIGELVDRLQAALRVVPP
jgi:tryptophan synthase alpha chain